MNSSETNRTSIICKPYKGLVQLVRKRVGIVRH